MMERIFTHIKSTIIGLLLCAFAGYTVSVNFDLLDVTAWIALGICAAVGLVLIFGKYDKLLDVIFAKLKQKQDVGEKE